MKRTYNTGYTLIELLVVAVLFSLVMVSVLSILAITVKNNYKAEKVMKLRKIGDNAVNVIHRIMITAKDIDEDNSSSSQLTLTQPGGINYQIVCNPNPTDETLTITGTNGVELIKTIDGIDIISCGFESQCLDSTSKSCKFNLELGLNNDTTEIFSTQATYRNEVF